MTPAPRTRDDVLYAFAVAHPLPDPAALDTYTRLYPEHAEALTQLALELMLEATEQPQDDGQAADAETVSPAVARAISHYQNAVFDLETKSGAAVANPFSGLDMTRFRAVTQAMHANNTFMTKIRDRLILPETVVSRPGFCNRLADELGVPPAHVVAHLQAAPTAGAHQNFKADAKPAASRQQSFEEAVRRSGLTEEQQAYLLGL